MKWPREYNATSAFGLGAHVETTGETAPGAEQNTTAIIMMPSEFVNVAGKHAEMLDRRGGKRTDA